MQKALIIPLFLFLTIIVFVFVSVIIFTTPPNTLSASQDDINLAQSRGEVLAAQVKETPPTPFSPSPTSIPSPTPRPTSKPTPRPTATSTLISSHTPTPTLSVSHNSVSLTSIQSYILSGVNSYRASQNLSSVTADQVTCSFAAVRAQEISQGFNHDGFTNRVSNHTLPYPTYHEVTENIAETSDYTQVATLWVNSPEHADNMRKDTPYVCIAQYENFYAYEGWKP